MNGSNTTDRADPVASGHRHDGSHPSVSMLFTPRGVAPHPFDTSMPFRPPLASFAGSRTSLWATNVPATTRRHGAPHTSHARCELPARMHGSIRDGGNVAKCAPENPRVPSAHTSRLFAPNACCSSFERTSHRALNPACL